MSLGGRRCRYEDSGGVNRDREEERMTAEGRSGKAKGGICRRKQWKLTLVGPICSLLESEPALGGGGERLPWFTPP